MSLLPIEIAMQRLRRPLRYLVACTLAASCALGALACSTEDPTSQETPAALAQENEAEGTADESAAQAIAADTASMDVEFSDRDLDGSYDETQATRIALSDDGATVEGDGATAEGRIVTVAEAGTYIVSGSAADCQIVVAAGDEDKVQLVLDGVSMSCTSGPCIDVESADKVFITLADGSENTLSDDGWTVTEESDEANATIYSRSDLAFNGTGALTVNATAHHAISSKDDLVIAGGTYAITAANDGLRGKDCVKIADGTFQIEAGDDAIVSSNDSDEDRGFVYVEGGTFAVTAGDDGIQATRFIELAGGTFAIEAGDDAVHSDLDLALTGADVVVNAADDAFHGEFNVVVSAGTLLAESCREGIEGESILIEDGDVTIYAQDDAINAAVGSADEDTGTDQEEDPMGQQPMQDGEDPMGQRPMQDDEGPMGQQPMGDATGMGEGPVGQQPMGGMGGMGGMGEGELGTAGNVTITGGRCVLVCTQDGDSLDSNGSLTMTGGLVLISGTETNGNGALDYDTSANITGGTIVAASSSGMAQSFGSESTQASVVANAAGNAGDLVSIVDAEGNVVVSYRSVNAFSWVLASSAAIEDGAEYHVIVGGTNSDEDEYGYAEGGSLEGGTEAATVTATTEAQGMMGGMGMGGMGGDTHGNAGADGADGA